MDLIGAILLMFVLVAFIFFLAIIGAILKIIFGLIAWVFGPINPFRK